MNGFSVMLYGMFLAIIMPEGKKNHVVLGAIIVSFVLSLLAAKLLPQLSDGMAVLLLTSDFCRCGNPLSARGAGRGGRSSRPNIQKGGAHGLTPISTLPLWR